MMKTAGKQCERQAQCAWAQNPVRAESRWRKREPGKSQKVLTAQELAGCRSLIQRMDRYARENGANLTVCDAAVWEMLAPGSEIGAQVYESFTDWELLDILRSRHAQASRKKHAQQDEVHKVYAAYLCKRFGNWQNANETAFPTKRQSERYRSRAHSYIRGLTQDAAEPTYLLLADQEAGLLYHRRAGEAIKALQARFRDASFPQIESYLAVCMQQDWENGFPQQRADATKVALWLDVMRRLYAQLQRTPLRLEVPHTVAFGLWRHCGSWGAALALAGLSPLSEAQRHAAAAQYRKSHSIAY